VTPEVTVIVPVFEHAAFVDRALASLTAQTLTGWEAVVVDDGSRDATPEVLAGWTADARFDVVTLPDNRGLGAACNVGLEHARAPYVAYLPADDVWREDHLERVITTARTTGATLVWSGLRCGDDTSLEPFPDAGLQLVQVLHERTDDRWVERSTFESDDLELTFLDQLRRRGTPASADVVTATWTQHPDQRSRHLRERHDGGLNVFRSRYRIREPLRIRSRDSGETDEVAIYARYREAPAPPRPPEGLRILLAGELAFHPDRVLVLRDRGHDLHGLWIDDTLGPHTVGPLPFPGVTEVARDRWRNAVRELAPDVVYAQQNWRAIPLAHDLLDLGTPLVWHFKESPQRAMARGTWPQLRDLARRAAACLFASEEEAAWFRLAVPDGMAPASVLDGDLANAARFEGEPAPRLSARDGAPHVACVGRPLGFDAAFLTALTRRGVHVHLHGLVDAPGPTSSWRRELDAARRTAPAHVHEHPAVPPHRWVEDLSRYDAGLLHRTTSTNDGDLRVATWDDLNLPARLSTYAAAVLPFVAPRLDGHRVAVQELIRRTGAGMLYTDADDLARRLHEEVASGAARASLAGIRSTFTFDHHAPRLEALLRDVPG
jgi:glycosyltransferase involved in cell wall biosynthesis